MTEISIGVTYFTTHHVSGRDLFPDGDPQPCGPPDTAQRRLSRVSTTVLRIPLWGNEHLRRRRSPKDLSVR
jgi:hypothetical protein